MTHAGCKVLTKQLVLPLKYIFIYQFMLYLLGFLVKGINLIGNVKGIMGWISKDEGYALFRLKNEKLC